MTEETMTDRAGPVPGTAINGHAATPVPLPHGGGAANPRPDDLPEGAIAVPLAAAEAFNAANAALRAGRWQEAADRAAEAVDSAPDLHPALMLRARALDRLGETAAAIAAYGALLQADPANHDALLETGNLYRRRGEIDAAARFYHAAARARPDDWRALFSLARLEEERGDTAADNRAGQALQQAMAVTARSGDGALKTADLLRHLAATRRQRGAHGRALEALRQARLTVLLRGRSLAARGAQTEGETGEPARLAALLARLDLEAAESRLHLGLTAQAEADMTRLSSASDPSLLADLAELSYRFNYWSEAVQVLTRRTDLLPGDPLALLALADKQAGAWLLEEALETLARAEALPPASEGPQAEAIVAAIGGMRARILGRRGEIGASCAEYERLIGAGHESFKAPLAMSMLYRDDLTAEDILQRHRKMFAPLDALAAPPSAFANPRVPDRRLRIGMVTGDLHRQHPVNIFLQPMLARWPQADMPLTVYFTGTTRDAQTMLAQERAGAWREVDAAALPRAVTGDEIDILIDLGGHSSGSAIEAMARRLAPVQASFLGYPSTTGVAAIDWLIGDAAVTPPEHDHLYSERIMRLPETVFCFAPETDHPLPDFTALADRALTFGSFNNLIKLSPETLALWAAVLRAVPQSRLVLRAPSLRDEGCVARHRRLFAEEGIADDRLDLFGPVALDEMMQDYARIDIGLDPLPFNGGTTSLQAMWMGVPVLTLTGDRFSARMGTSFNRAAGLDGFIAENKEDFIARAIALAEDRPALTALKAGLRARMQDLPGWDAQRYTASFAAALRQMWQEHCRA